MAKLIYAFAWLWAVVAAFEDMFQDQQVNSQNIPAQIDTNPPRQVFRSWVPGSLQMALRVTILCKTGGWTAEEHRRLQCDLATSTLKRYLARVHGNGSPDKAFMEMRVALKFGR